MNFSSGTTFSSSAGSTPRISGASRLCLELDDDRALDVRRGRRPPPACSDFHRQIAPLAQDVFGADQDVRIEIDHLLPQLPIEARHHRDDKNEHHHSEHHTDDRDEGDDRNEGAFRLQIAQCEKEAEWKFQGGGRLWCVGKGR